MSSLACAVKLNEKRERKKKCINWIVIMVNINIVDNNKRSAHNKVCMFIAIAGQKQYSNIISNSNENEELATRAVILELSIIFVVVFLLLLLFFASFNANNKP